MGISIEEKRIYDASGRSRPVYVVGEFGVARVEVSDDYVGEFGLARQCSARDAAGRENRVAVATDEDVLVGVFGSGEADGSDDPETAPADQQFEALGLGPATAVGLGDGGELLVAREDGTVVQGDAGDWTELGEADEVRAIDGDLVATAEGVYQATDDGLRHVGLDDARDATADGVPLAATGDGLYRLANGWMDELDGEFRAVSAAASDPGTLGWAHAASESGLVAHEDGEWREVEVPVDGEVVALDHGEGAYAATADGTLLVSVGDGWQYQMLGLRGVRAVAAP